MMDDLRAHLPTLLFQQFLKNSVTLIPLPPYSPNLTPSNLFLFPWMKKVFKGQLFTDVEKVKQKTAGALKGIKIDQFKHCFEQWKETS